jgi:hypothetical protein
MGVAEPPTGKVMRICLPIIFRIAIAINKLDLASLLDLLKVGLKESPLAAVCRAPSIYFIDHWSTPAAEMAL